MTRTYMEQQSRNYWFRIKVYINPIQSSFAFHIETSHLICSANQMNDFYMECNTVLKRVKAALEEALP